MWYVFEIRKNSKCLNKLSCVVYEKRPLTELKLIDSGRPVFVLTLTTIDSIEERRILGFWIMWRTYHTNILFLQKSRL